MASPADIEANNATPNGDLKIANVNGPPSEKKPGTATSLWSQSVSARYADLLCLILCFITGLCDSAAYNAWSCFLAMQTGSSH